MVRKRLLLLLIALCFPSNVSAFNYKINKGDTLKELSKRFNLTVGELIELNGLKGGRIYIGGVIFIPESVTDSDYALINESSIEHKAAESDTLLDIGDEFAVKVNDKKTVNNLRTDRLRIGPTMFIPLLTLLIDKVEDPKNDVTISDRIYNHHLSQPPASEPVPPLRYSVKKGDTLSEISGDFGVAVQDLMRINGLSDSRLKTGVILVIPSTGTNGILRNITHEKRLINYIAKDGDTIEELSKRFDIPIHSIKAANYLTDNIVTAGEILAIPDSKYEKESVIQVGTITGETRLQDLNIPNELNSQSLDEKVDNYKQKRNADNNFDLITNRIINAALMFLGVPYKFGGNSPSTGLDCSAYVKKVFRILNIDLPRTARDIYHVGKYVQKSQLATGDLVFFRTYARYPSHVGIYLGDNKFIHASSRSKMVTIDDLDFNYYKKRYIGAKRIESAGLFFDELSKIQMVFDLN
ncbi:MAG: LysM peptidoglycan-binding domain-containing protein [Thermodesulfobacteriota bacterium]